MPRPAVRFSLRLLLVASALIPAAIYWLALPTLHANATPPPSTAAITRRPTSQLGDREVANSPIGNFLRTSGVYSANNQRLK